MKLAIITTHPIQYYAPVFKLLHERQKISIMVFYTWGEGSVKKYDPGFGSAISWDIPLLDGYPYTWVKNTAADPGSHHYKGIINPGLIRQIQDWKADAVLVFGWAWQSHLKAMRFFKGRIPVYFRGDSTLLNEPKGIRKLIKTIFLKWVYSHVDHAFYVGVNNYEYYKRYGLKDGQLSFAPHAIDNGRFMQDHHTEARNLRTSLDLSEDDILVLYAGKFEQVKNLTLLLETFIRLNKPDVHLLLAGNGPEESVLKDMASRSQYIHFTGFKNQSYMPALYQACDLFCLSSFSETWGLAVNEAMACGRAVLVSDKVGCAPDLVKKEFNGAIFKSGDKDDLAGCLEKLTGSKNVLEQMGKKSAQMIEDWNFTHIAEAIENKLPAGENQDMG